MVLVVLDKIKNLIALVIVKLVCLYIVIMSDPDIILRKDNKDPYRAWVIRIAKMKKGLYNLLRIR